MALTLSAKGRARWVWLTGMMVVSPHLGRYRLTEANQTRPTPDCAPDLSDPVTAACLPLVVGAVWGDESPYCKGLHDSWTVYVWTKDDVKHAFNGTTRLAAWIAALEAAP